MFSAVYFPMAVTGWGQECTNTEMRNSKRVLRERGLCVRLLMRREFKKFQAEPRCCDGSGLPDNGDF